jgi:hypothetical protein
MVNMFTSQKVRSRMQSDPTGKAGLRARLRPSRGYRVVPRLRRSFALPLIWSPGIS